MTEHGRRSSAQSLWWMSVPSRAAIVDIDHPPRKRIMKCDSQDDISLAFARSFAICTSSNSELYDSPADHRTSGR
jgi:hypothetical protein